MGTVMCAVDDAGDRYFDIEGLSRYSGLSVRTLRRYMNDPDRPLPHHHVRGGGKERGRVLIRKSAFDAWVELFPRLKQKDPPAAATTAAWVRRLAR
jgi:hypothetical protein